MDSQDFRDASHAAALEGDLAKAHAKIARLTRAKTAAARVARDALEERDEAVKALEVHQAAADAAVNAPRWLTPKATRKGRARSHRGTVCVLMTDQHFDEVVRPEELDGYNAYNRDIAELRLRRAFERTIILARDHVTGIDYDGAVCMFGGDVVTGYIHDELVATNADTLAGTVVHWTERLVAGVRMLADEFGSVHVPCVTGNHDRWGKRPRSKLRARDSLTWIVYNFMARQLDGDERVTFQIGEAADVLFPVYGTRYLLTHGDQFRGGSGISGALAPLMLGTHRKGRRNDALGMPYDVMVMGHWHQHLTLPGLIVGNTLKGYDEYAYTSNFVPSPPSQAWWVTTPEHGPTFHAEVKVCDRKAEGW